MGLEVLVRCLQQHLSLELRRRPESVPNDPPLLARMVRSCPTDSVLPPAISINLQDAIADIRIERGANAGKKGCLAVSMQQT